MNVFCIKDKIRISLEFSQYSANKNWVGKIGEVIKVLAENLYLVKWEHFENPIVQYGDFIERV